MKTKLLVIALAASIFSVNASAARVTPTSTQAFATNASSGNSSLMLSVWNANGSYTFDLGTTLNNLVGADTVTDKTDEATFLSSQANSLTVANTSLLSSPLVVTLTDFNNFTTLYGAATSWNLVAADKDNIRNRALYSVVAGSDLTGTKNGSVTAVGVALDGYISDLAGTAATNPVTGGSGDAWYAAAESWAGDAVSNTVVSWGSSADMYLTAQNSFATNKQVNGLASAYNTFTAGFSTLNGQTILTISSVAAVPEADTSAMLLAGIGFMGFIARRRKTY